MADPNDQSIEEQAEEEMKEAIEKFKAMKPELDRMSNNKCSKCNCNGFIPRVTNPNQCKRRGCGHVLQDHF